MLALSGLRYDLMLHLDSVEEGDPATGLWRQVTRLPTPRGDVACAVVGGKLYIAGGYNDPQGGARRAVVDPWFGPSQLKMSEKARQARGLRMVPPAQLLMLVESVQTEVEAPMLAHSADAVTRPFA